MKLINKFTIFYIIITAIMLLVGGIMVFNAVLEEVDKEAQRKVRVWLKITVDQVENGVPIDQLDINNVDIEELDYDAPLIPFYEIDSIGIFPPKLHGEDRKLTVGASYKINGKHYHISTFSFIAEPDEVETGLKRSLFTTFGIFVVIAALLSLFVSSKILNPFNKSLIEMNKFSVKNQKPIKTWRTNTKEFRQLNHFLKKMTSKALEDYRVLKEFSENASHEIRTPLAVIRGKLELLIDTPISEEQAKHIHSIEGALHKLSTINQSLLLLTKLENQEYESNDTIDFSNVLDNTLLSFQELIDMKSIRIKKNIAREVHVKLNIYLAEILLNNLIGNAIRHNIAKGEIQIHLDNDKLEIKNTGEAIDVNPKTLFERFKKYDQSSESTGLGLAIVKQICDVNNLQIDYKVRENFHIITVYFTESNKY